MAKETYIERRFTEGTLAIIMQANSIIKEYQEDGYKLTVRQLYYQFVSRDLFTENRRFSWTGKKWVKDIKGTINAQPNYEWLGSMLTDGRLAGLVDWDAIEDRTRFVRDLAHWRNPADIMRTVVQQYRIDKWGMQPYRLEIWIEKDALTGILESVCEKNDVPYFSCRGYVSLSEMYAAAQRFNKYIDVGQEPVIVHLGDHDPSGLDMTRDIKDRLGVLDCRDVKVVRAALNADQVEQYNPPPNPAKLTDSRCRAYIAEHGTNSWELDALEPAVITQLIKRYILHYRNEATWDKAVRSEKLQRSKLNDVYKNM